MGVAHAAIFYSRCAYQKSKRQKVGSQGSTSTLAADDATANKTYTAHEEGYELYSKGKSLEGGVLGALGMDMH